MVNDASVYKNNDTVNDHWDWYYDSKRANNYQSYHYFTVIFITSLHGIDRVQPCYFTVFHPLHTSPRQLHTSSDVKSWRNKTSDKSDEKRRSREEKQQNDSFLSHNIYQWQNFMQEFDEKICETEVHTHPERKKELRPSTWHWNGN